MEEGDSEMGAPTIELRHISKRFAKVLANDDISIKVEPGEVVALLGENGAGKSTIMKILYGLYRATEGEILIDGKTEKIASPRDAIDKGISMIQQHFSLVAAHTVTENIILGNCKGVIDYEEKAAEIQKLSDRYGFGIDAGAYIRDLTVGMQQKVEILKALHLDTSVLIMDEPTAVLTPQETSTLMAFIRDYASRGNSVIFITHKMKEVMEVADRIIVMRNGKITGEVRREETDETELARMMIGHDLDSVKAPGTLTYDGRKKRLEVRNVSIKADQQLPLLDDVSFDIYEGEVLGIAGVSGNGQQELCEAIYGHLSVTEGEIILDGKDITHSSVSEHIAAGVGYLASDRYRYGMVKDMSLSENMLLKASRLDTWIRRGIVDWKGLHSYTDDKIREYAIKAPGHEVTAGSLSGGNQQKIVVAREVDMGGKLMIFDQPTRGLDLGAINYVHKTIVEQKESGKSVLLISTELSEIFALSDRIAVLYRGKIMGIYVHDELTTESIGLLMAGYDITGKRGAR